MQWAATARSSSTAKKTTFINSFPKRITCSIAQLISWVNCTFSYSFFKTILYINCGAYRVIRSCRNESSICNKKIEQHLRGYAPFDDFPTLSYTDDDLISGENLVSKSAQQGQEDDEERTELVVRRRPVERRSRVERFLRGRRRQRRRWCLQRRRRLRRHRGQQANTVADNDSAHHVRNIASGLVASREHRRWRSASGGESSAGQSVDAHADEPSTGIPATAAAIAVGSPAATPRRH